MTKNLTQRRDPELDAFVTDAVRQAQQAAASLAAFTDVVEQLADLASDQNQPLLLTVEEAAKLLNVGRTTAYDMIKRGDLPVVHIGKSARVRRSDIDAYVDNLVDRHAS